MKKLLSLVGVALLSSTLTLFSFLFFKPTLEKIEVEPVAPVLPTAYAYNLNGENKAPSDFVNAAEKSIDAVVHVKNTAISEDSFPP